jgi:hypothetical protein
MAKVANYPFNESANNYRHRLDLLIVGRIHSKVFPLALSWGISKFSVAMPW